VFLVLRPLGKVLPGMALVGYLLPGIPAVCIAEAGDKSMEPRLTVLPQEVLPGDPINIRASGLSAGQIGCLTVSGRDEFGNLWSSKASFKARQKRLQIPGPRSFNFSSGSCRVSEC
jgi:hypothetical protein